MKAYINHISAYIPKNEISNEMISEKFPEWNSEKILNKIGIQSRFITKSDEFVSDIAVKALENLIEESDISKDDIDYLILCTQSPDYYLPATACIVQNKAGLSTKCAALDINQGCSGYIYALSLAKGLVISETAKNVVVITAEIYSKHIHPEDKGNLSLFGDAATATLISSEGDFEIKKFSLGTDGAGSDNLIVRRGGIKCEKTQDANDMDNYLYMNGSEIFDFTSKTIPPLIEENLLKNNLEKEDVDTFVFHQANTFMLNFLRKKIQIPEDKFIIDMLNYGNTVSSTIPIALKNLILKKRMMKNMMLVGFGVGYSWGAVCVEKVK